MITVEGLHKRLGTEPVLRGIDLEIERGEIVALVGPSGTGKSVLLKHIIGLVRPDHGDVRIDGRSIARARRRDLDRLRRRMGYAFQDGALLDSLTVRDNLRLALDGDLRDTATEHEDRIRDAMGLVNLPLAVLDRLPNELSGGMRKRVGVARAVLHSPDIVLFDEPTTGLDPANVEAVHRLVHGLRDRHQATCVVVTHDLLKLQGLADRVVLILDGRVHADTSPARLFASRDPRVREFIGSTHQQEEA